MRARARRRRAASFSAFLASTILLSGGCAPRIVVHANPDRAAQGIRFYRPKPYLKVEPAEAALDKNRTAPIAGMVRVTLQYLPDFSEEYAIDVRSGFGRADVGIKLDDGWNLTEISQDLDSQQDESLEALAELAGSVAQIVPTSTANTDVSLTVAASNVPIGFYESVIGRDPRGCKQLYGFRYVGFLPFSPCPLEVGGNRSGCCADGMERLYGLAFRDGQMSFVPLDEMPGPPPADRTSTDDLTPSVVETSGPPLPTRADIDLRRLPIELRAHLAHAFPQIGEVGCVSQGDHVRIEIGLPDGLPSAPIHDAAQQWLVATHGADTSFDLHVRRADKASVGLLGDND